MIEFTVIKTKLKVSPMFFAVLTMLFLTDKTGIATIAFIFSLLHECGHFIALICTKTIMSTIEFTAFGIHIILPGNLSTIKKIIVLIAGFAVNYVLAGAFFACKKAVFANVNLLIGIFTSLPMSSTDGGDLLDTFLNEIFPFNAEKYYKKIALIFSMLISILLIFIVFLTGNYFVLIGLLYTVLNTLKIIKSI